MISSLQKSVRQCHPSSAHQRGRARAVRVHGKGVRAPTSDRQLSFARHADVDVIPLQAKIQSEVRFPYGRSLNKESKNKVFGDLRAAPAHLPSDLAAALHWCVHPL
ncbi:hypothetical protein CHARACLAT_010872 [Characodon lateralis]|uniref:Uncharacterized protein n=1 Tax=Characodon lateralis TaxID=208331 RepID=A0ABU7CQH2_9TELE|nr:hypothetical protein [Characodon lateralis]